jgi:hypothetical protein
MVARPTNTSDKEYAPRAWVTKIAKQSKDVAQAGVIQIDLCDMKMRIHDACNHGGGAYVMLVSNCPDSNGNLPIPAPATIIPDVTIPANAAGAAATTAITHNLGFRPVAQLILASTGQVVDNSDGYTITHTSTNVISITRPANSPATILILRT